MRKIPALISLLLTAGIGCSQVLDSKDFPLNGAFILTTDYSTGSFSTIDIDTLEATVDTARNGIVHSDAAVSVFNGKVYVVNRLGRDNIQILDPETNYTTVREITTGSNSNPQDIMVINETTAYVTRYSDSKLWIINPATGQKTGEINLSSYADTDGLPEMAGLYYSASSELLFVSLQRLDSTTWYTPTDYSSIIVINTNTDAVANEIVLYAQNPISLIRFVSKTVWQPATPDDHDHIFIACVGNYGAKDGGIVAIDIEDLTCETGFVISEAAIDGDIADFHIKSATVGYVTDSYKLSTFNPQTGLMTGTLLNNGSNYSLVRLDMSSSGRLFVCDRTSSNPGIRIFDTNDADQPLNSGNPIDVGLPPVDIVFLEK